MISSIFSKKVRLKESADGEHRLILQGNFYVQEISSTLTFEIYTVAVEPL